MLRAFGRATSTTSCRAQWQRAFFNLGKSSFVEPVRESETQNYHERRILPYRRSELYQVIADVESYSNFVPYCASSRVLERKVSQDGITVMEAELAVGFLAFRESYVSTVTCKPHESVQAVASSSTPLFKTLTTVWRFQPMSCASTVDRGPTLVTLDLAFAFANPTHAVVSATFFGQVSRLMVDAFEQRCAVLYRTC